MQKLAGVESVKVSLNEGHAKLVLKGGNSLTMAQVRGVVERNGFTPQQAVVAAEAEVLTRDGGLHVRILGVDEIYGLDASTSGAIGAEVKKHNGRTVRIEGIIRPSRDKQKPTMQVTSILAAERKA